MLQPNSLSISIVMAPNPPSPNDIFTDNAEQPLLLKLENPRSNGFINTSTSPWNLFYIIQNCSCSHFHHFLSLILLHRSTPIGRSGILGPPFLHCEQYHSYPTSSSLTARRYPPVKIVAVITTVAILTAYFALGLWRGVIDEIRVRLIIYYISTLPRA